MSPDLTIILVSYDTRDLLRAALKSIPAGLGSASAEIVVVDNASRDGSVEMVVREFPGVRAISNQSNLGFAAANNLALREAHGRCCVLLNSDTVVHPATLANLLRFMDETPAAGYCGPRLLNTDGSHQPSAFRFHTILTDVLPIVGMARNPRSRHTVNLHAHYGDRGTFRADWLMGACLMVRREAIRAVGMLDEKFFLYFEEVDWCRRMHTAGWEGWYVGSAEVIHHSGQSVKYDTDARPFWGHAPGYHVRSFRRYMRRHHGWIGMATACTLQLLAYGAVWVRNSWPWPDRSRHKARNAAEAIGCLLGLSDSR